ncbi:MAG: glycosyltransferase family 2 protein [Pseudomonadota bacterium]
MTSSCYHDGNFAVSIVITFRDTGPYIFEAIESALNQTHYHLELLLVDDNPTGREQLEFLERRLGDPRIRLLKNPIPGRVRALNFGIRQARHGIIAILDDDDVWHRSKLEFDVKAIKKGADFVCWRHRLFTERPDLETSTTAPRLEEIPRWRMLMRNQLTHSTVTAKRTLMRYDERLETSEDYDLFLRLQHDQVRLQQYNKEWVAIRVRNTSHFTSKGWPFYWKSAALQIKHILRSPHWWLLPVPIVRFAYTPFRQKLRLRRAARTAPPRDQAAIASVEV